MSRTLGAFLRHGTGYSVASKSVLTPRGRILAMGYPLSPYNQDYTCAFENIMQTLSPAQIISLAGNAYHVHENMLFMMFVFSNIRRRDAVVGAPTAGLAFEYDGGGDSDPDDDAQ